MFIALGNIEQTKLICEIFIKINLYMDYIPKESN